MSPFQWLTWIMMLRFLLLGEFPSALAKQPLVKIHDGLLRGNYERTFHGTIYSSFQGIPYASPPTENLRFAAPIPNKPWSDTLDVSTNCTIKCPQMDGTAMDWKSTEDCLYLSVYSPFLLRSPKDVPKRRDRAPVLVFFHGGGFTSGSGMYYYHGPNRFLDYRIIIVSMNFRQGPLGFFTTGTPEAPGNQALRDQQLALKWVKKNIAAFGGNPRRVTISGESSGSWSVFYQMLSPKSKGLFHGVIGQSGTPLAPAWPNLTKAKAVRYGKLLINACGCGNAEDQLSCMREVPVQEIIQATKSVDDQDDRMLIFHGYNGMIDGDITDDPFLPKDPVDILEKGTYNKKVRVLLGVNRDEGLIITSNCIKDPTFYEEWRTKWDHYGPLLLFGIESEERTERDICLADEVLEFYLRSRKNIDKFHLDELTDLFSDSSYWYGTHLWANYMLRDGITTYQYMFSFKGRRSILDFNGIEGRKYGVSHADELFYFWHPFLFEQPDFNEAEEVVSNQLIAMWVNFATSRDPTPRGSGNVKWKPITSKEHSYLEINYRSQMRHSTDYKQRMLFWLQNNGLRYIKRTK